MLLIFGIFMIYAGYIGYNLLATEIIRRYVKVGDPCKVYIDDEKLPALVVKVNSEVEVWISDRILRISRKDIYC